jgi:hypothetical protein
VPETPITRTTNLLEVSTRAEHARRIITGFSLATPNLTDLWRQVGDALADIPILVMEITSLQGRLTACRIDRANLAAAGRIAIAAYRNGESDPLAYLQDELLAQGFSTGRREA